MYSPLYMGTYGQLILLSRFRTNSFFLFAEYVPMCGYV